MDYMIHRMMHPMNVNLSYSYLMDFAGWMCEMR